MYSGVCWRSVATNNWGCVFFKAIPQPSYLLLVVLSFFKYTYNAFLYIRGSLLQKRGLRSYCWLLLLKRKEIKLAVK